MDHSCAKRFLGMSGKTRERSTKLGDDDLLGRTERQARAGARIVFWAEENAPVLKQDEAALISGAGEVALRNGIYIGMALESWDPAQPKPLENKLVLVKPDGQVAWQYVKSHPTPGPEADVSSERGSRLRSLATPYGVLSAMICYDADFPPLAAQAGRLGADIVLDPASDWRAIDPWHTQMASFRAIEQGFNLVRQTKFGLSAAYDYQGRRLAAMDEFEAKDFVLVAEVPTRGVRTIYSRLGDWLAWLCIAGLLVLMAYTWRKQRVAANG